MIYIYHQLDNRFMRYDSVWWKLLLDTLNNSPYCRGFEGLGIVSFESINIPDGKVYVCWDSSGIGSIVTSTNCPTNHFSATSDMWTQFIQGNLNAAQCVLLGKIKFSGSLIHVVKYLSAFNNLKLIANKLNSNYDGN